MAYAIRRLGIEAFLPPPVPYVDALGLLGFLGELEFKVPTLLIGPTGLGKTQSVYAWAEARGCPLIEYSCTEDTRASDFIGRFGIDGGETFFTLGAATTAIEIANDMARDETSACMGAVLLLNEINALAPQAQKALNSLLDFQRSISAPSIGHTFMLDDDAELWVVATMNPSAYGGTFDMNQDMVSRFVQARIPHPTPVQEEAILRGLRDSDNPQHTFAMSDICSVAVGGRTVRVDALTQIAKLAEATRTTKMRYQLSTRDLHQLCRLSDTLGLSRALLILANKFEEDEDRNFYVSQVQSLFSIDLEAIRLFGVT